MKIMLGVAGFALISAALAAPAHAQSGPTINSQAGINASGSINDMGAASAFPPTPALPVTSFRGTSARGIEYIPSTYVPYDKALAEGREIKMEQPKTLGQVAMENRGVVRPKARILLIGDSNGLAIRSL
jgi:hypothetical protein